MNTGILIGYLLGVLAATCLSAVWNDDVGYAGGALLGLTALACTVAAFVLTFWGYLKWLI